MWLYLESLFYFFVLQNKNQEPFIYVEIFLKNLVIFLKLESANLHHMKLRVFF